MGDQNYHGRICKCWVGGNYKGETVSWQSDDGNWHDSKAERDTANAGIVERRWLVDTARAILWPEEVAAERRQKILAELRRFLYVQAESEKYHAALAGGGWYQTLIMSDYANLISAVTALEYLDELAEEKP